MDRQKKMDSLKIAPAAATSSLNKAGSGSPIERDMSAGSEASELQPFTTVLSGSGVANAKARSKEGPVLKKLHDDAVVIKAQLNDSGFML